MADAWQWIKDNHKWLFDGLGISIIGGLIWLVRFIHQERNAKNSNDLAIQAERKENRQEAKKLRNEFLMKQITQPATPAIAANAIGPASSAFGVVNGSVTINPPANAQSESNVSPSADFGMRCFEVHQTALELCIDLHNHCATQNAITPLLVKSETWFKKNQLFLQQKARTAFDNAIRCASLHPSLLQSPGNHEQVNANRQAIQQAIDVIMKAGDELKQSPASPAIATIEQIKIDVKKAYQPRRVLHTEGDYLDTHTGREIPQHQVLWPHEGHINLICYNLTSIPVMVHSVRVLDAKNDRQVTKIEINGMKIDSHSPSLPIDIEVHAESEDDYIKPLTWQGLVEIITVRGGVFRSEPFRWVQID